MIIMLYLAEYKLRWWSVLWLYWELTPDMQ